jgi:hypothetical protein
LLAERCAAARNEWRALTLSVSRFDETQSPDVIASEAKQSSLLPELSGLLRREAPRMTALDSM